MRKFDDNENALVWIGPQSIFYACAQFYVIIQVTWRINYNIGAILRYMLSFYKAKTWYWN